MLSSSFIPSCDFTSGGEKKDDARDRASEPGMAHLVECASSLGTQQKESPALSAENLDQLKRALVRLHARCSTGNGTRDRKGSLVGSVFSVTIVGPLSVVAKAPEDPSYLGRSDSWTYQRQSSGRRLLGVDMAQRGGRFVGIRGGNLGEHRRLRPIWAERFAAGGTKATTTHRLAPRLE